MKDEAAHRDVGLHTPEGGPRLSDPSGLPLIPHGGSAMAGLPPATPAMFKTAASVNSRAYNIYQYLARESLRVEYPAAASNEVESMIGAKWSQMPDQEKEVFVNQAQGELQDLIERGLVDASVLKKKRYRRTKAEIELARAQEASSPQMKKKRGRPTKEEAMARELRMIESGQSMPGGSYSAPAQSSGGMVKKGRRKREGGEKGLSHAFLGKNVTGIFDGAFDAGYFVTVRVENTDMVFRGVVFGPGVAVPAARSDLGPSMAGGERMHYPRQSYSPAAAGLMMSGHPGQGPPILPDLRNPVSQQ